MNMFCQKNQGNVKKVCILLFVAFLLVACSNSEGASVSEDNYAVSDGEGSHTAMNVGHHPEIDVPSPIELNLSRGQEIGAVYEAFLSPEQEGGEEEDTPDAIPDVFRSTAPSVSRELRTSHGHGVLSFTNDLSKAYVHVAIENVNPEDIVMFHIHCGLPGQLGPIIVDFNLKGNPSLYFEDGVFFMEILNEDIVAVTDHSEGLVGAFTAGCPIILSVPTDRVKTIAGMQQIAEEGELYFNLHTKGQTYFGDIRGQLRRVETPPNNQTSNQ